ncbi:hypothetical protein ACLKA7_003190 [Drosophila subpalustris]
MSNDGKNKRSENFTVNEELVLTSLVDERKHVLQNRESNIVTWNRKLDAWKELADCYFAKTGVRREWQALRQKFMRLKHRSTAQQRTERKPLSYFRRKQPLPTAEVPMVNDLVAEMSNTVDSDGSDDLSFLGKDKLLNDTAYEHDATNPDENEEDMAAFRSECAIGSSSTNGLPKPRNHNLEEETLKLIRLQQEFFRCKNQRAQEKHDLEMLREKAKLEQEMQEGQLRIEMIELEILEKRANLDMKCGQEATNPGEQFFMFTLICWWLCKKLGKDMERPQEYDDPNTVIAKIMQMLEEIDVPVDFAPNKLIRGAGPICLMVLDILATQALKVTKVNYQRLHIAQEEEFVGDYLEDNAEIILEKLEDEQNASNLSDDSDMELEAHNFKQLNWLNRQERNLGEMSTNGVMDEHNRQINDHREWRLELERVLQQLKVFVKADARDWRTHISQMEALNTAIANVAEPTQVQLKKLHSEFTFSLEKIESREKHLNNELQPLIQQYKELSIELSTVQYAQNQLQADMEEKMNTLSEVMAEQELKKEEMERRGQVMSDGSSVQQIKKAIVKLKDDISQLNLEVALLVHAYDQDTVRQTLGVADQANN